MSNDLHNLISLTFEKNIEYLEKSHPSLFEKILAYENAVTNGNYQERYELNYKNGDFDIFDKKNETFFYKEKPLSFIDAIVQSFTFLRSENVFMAFKSGMFDLSAEVDEMKSLKKFLFFGVGTGSHIVEIHQKIHASSYFIIENDLELFRLSLMSTPYYEIAEESKIFFSIFDEESEFASVAKFFLENQFYYNQYIKFLQLPDSCEDKVKLFHAQITKQSHLNFGYKSILSQYTKPLQLIKSGYNFLNIIKEANQSTLKESAVLLVAPGPSLGKNIEWLKANQDKFVIVALSATLTILEKNNIIPDIVTHTDGFERSIVHFEKLNSKEFLQESIFLFSARTPQKIINMFAKDKMFFFENGTNYKEDFGSFSAFCAGSSTYLLLVVLQVQRIYLLGLDLAVDAKTLQTHSSEYSYNLEAKESSDILSFRNSLIQREGNFQEHIATTPNFAISIDAIDEINTTLKQEHQTIYNFNDGAYFQNTIAVEIKNIDKKSQIKDIVKKEFREEIKKSFSFVSENYLTQDEQKKIDDSMALTRRVEDKLLEISKRDFSRYDVLLESLIEFSEMLSLESQDETVVLLLQNYSKAVFPYIFDYFNAPMHMKKGSDIATLVFDEMLRVSQEYRSQF